MKTLLTLAFVAGALLLGATPAGVEAAARFSPQGVIPHESGIRATTPSSSTAAAPSCGSISCSAYETGVNQYFQDVAADSGGTANVYSAATQYSSIAYSETFGGSYVDTTPYPASGCTRTGTFSACLSESQLQTAIQRDIAANGWTAGGSSLFFILLPSNVNTCFTGGTACASNYFCAYHDSFSNVIFAVEPFNDTLGGCFVGAAGQGAPNGEAIDASLNTISHEQNEAITDPFGTGWYTSPAGDENGDLCAWSFGSPLGTVGGQPYNQVINGHDYSLQQEYSNAATGCVQHLGGTASSPTSGNGPLIYHGGAVMQTNTVYTIYWIPTSSAAPTNSAPPVVSGVAGVGKTLTTTSGTWSGSPTSFGYRWQQCSATGTSCTNISGATGSTYKLAAGDAGHEIRSEVSATNSGGTSSFAASTPTEIVIPVPAITAAPAVSGVAAAGKTLSTTQGTWNTPVTYAYQWLRCSPTGTSCSPIAQATSSTYVVSTADRGHELEARVSATNAAATTAAVSAPTAVVVGVPASSRLPAISGKAKVGKRLSVDIGGWIGSPSRFRYQWLRCGKGGGSCVRIKRATKSSYRLTKHDAHHRLRVRVTATNTAGSSNSTSAASHVVKR